MEDKLLEQSKELARQRCKQAQTDIKEILTRYGVKFSVLVSTPGGVRIPVKDALLPGWEALVVVDPKD